MAFTTFLDNSATPTKLMLKGDGGAGKTFTALSLCLANEGNVAFFNLDKNLATIRAFLPEERKRVLITDSKATRADFWKTFIADLKVALADPSVTSIIIDSLTSLSARIKEMMGIMDVKGSPKDGEGKWIWGNYAAYIHALCSQVLLSDTLDKNVIIVAHEVAEKDELLGTIKYKPLLSGQMQDQLPLYFTDIWNCQKSFSPVVGVPPSYEIATVGTAMSAGKCSAKVAPIVKYNTPDFKTLCNLFQKVSLPSSTNTLTK